MVRSGLCKTGVQEAEDEDELASIGMKRLFLSISSSGCSPRLFVSNSRQHFELSLEARCEVYRISRYGFFWKRRRTMRASTLCMKHLCLTQSWPRSCRKWPHWVHPFLSSITTATAGPISMCSIAGRGVKTRSTTTFATDVQRCRAGAGYRRRQSNWQRHPRVRSGRLRQ